MRENKGFTLVELAVVMVIIGLLIGGVLKGQELVENARMTATVAQVEAYKAAVYTFRDKYNAMPGDMTRATTRLPGCGISVNCQEVGDGNGRVGVPITNWSRDGSGGTPLRSIITSENTQFWIHLALAGLITGVNAEGGLAWNGVYPDAAAGGGFHVIFAQETGANMANGHYFVLRTDPVGDSMPGLGGAGAVLTGIQAALLDEKIDDGVANVGTMLSDTGGRGGLPTCSNDNGEYTFVQEEACLSAFRFFR